MHRRFEGYFVPAPLMHVPDHDMRAVIRGKPKVIAKYGITQDDLIEAFRQDFREHLHDRPCPEGCGCVEFYDDRSPEVSDGRLAPLDCRCQRCKDDQEDADD